MEVKFYTCTDAYDSDYGDDAKFEYLGTIEIRDARWMMSVSGVLSFQLIPTDPFWFSKIQSKRRDLKASKQLVLLVDSPSLSPHDTFDVYLTRDPTIFQHYEQLFNDEGLANASYLVLKLKSRVYNKDVKTLDIRHYPTKCLMCGADINRVYCYGDENGQYLHFCTNPHCTVYVYRDISRFLTMTLHIYGYNGFIQHLVRTGLIRSPTDLWEPHVRKRFKDFTTREYAKDFTTKLDSKLGQVLLSDYLRCLPIPITVVDRIGGASLSDRWLYGPSVDATFGCDPKEFGTFIYDQFNTFLNDDDYHRWVGQNGAEIVKYMSLPLFFEYAELYSDPEASDYMESDYMEQLVEFSRLHMFTDKPLQRKGDLHVTSR